MAIRVLLHMNKLKDFESWLEKQGYMISPTSKNPYEILRAKKDKDIVIIYQKSDSKEYLSIMDKDHALIQKFIMESKPKTNADRIRNMSDEELADSLTSIAKCGECFVIKEHEPYCLLASACRQKHLEWLQSEAE